MLGSRFDDSTRERHLSQQSFPSQPDFSAGGRPAGGDRQAARGNRRRSRLPDAARRHRLGQDLHAGQRHRPPRPAGAGAGAEQDARGPALLEFREFFPENAVEYFVSYYDYYQPEAYVPSRDLYIEKDSSINEHIEQMRLSATKSLLERRDVIIVGTVSAIYGIGDPGEYHGMILHLRQGEKMAQRDVAGAAGGDAVRAQRARLPPRHLPRAGRRDRHLPGRARRARDPHLARGRRDRQARGVRPADRPGAAPDGALHGLPLQPLRDAARDHAAARSRQIKAELRERIEFFQDAGRLVEAQRIEQRTRFDLEMLAELGFCKGIENYSRHLSGRAGGRAAADADRLPGRQTR